VSLRNYVWKKIVYPLVYLSQIYGIHKKHLFYSYSIAKILILFFSVCYFICYCSAVLIIQRSFKRTARRPPPSGRSCRRSGVWRRPPIPTTRGSTTSADSSTTTRATSSTGRIRSAPTPVRWRRVSGVCASTTLSMRFCSLRWVNSEAVVSFFIWLLFDPLFDASPEKYHVFWDFFWWIV